MSDSDSAAAVFLDLGSRTPKRFLQGTHRSLAPDETLARAAPFLPGMGITRVANVTGLDRIGVPVVMVVRPNARSVSVSQGKGLSLAAAKASGVMEAIELHHAERVDNPVVFASPRDLAARRRVIDLETLPRPQGSRLDRGRKLLWVEGQELFSAAGVCVPYELVSADYTRQRPPGAGTFLATTNGLASGNDMAEAVCHGLCEVIEREATAAWSLLGRRARIGRRIDPASIDQEDCKALLETFRRAEISFAVWDTTTEIGIAAFECLIADARGEVFHSARGAGCHPDRGTALIRALTEAAQVRATYIAAARDDMSPAEFESERRRRRSELALGLIAEGPAARDFSKVPSHDAPSFEEDIAHILESLEAVGLKEVAVVDLTKPEVGLPVVRVVVPGLRCGTEEAAEEEAAPRPLRRGVPDRSEAYVFAGPSLNASEIEDRFAMTALPPARQGDVLWIAQAKPRAIGIVDGFFDGTPAPWHKEILWAMQQGIHVFGAGSMGALRASELYGFGMRGVGRIFEAFRDGALEDDDEVAVLHGPPEMGFRPLSEAMICLREAIRRAAEEGILGAEAAALLTSIAKASFYQDRSWDGLLAEGRARGLPEEEIAALDCWRRQAKVDLKRDDALEMLGEMARFLAGDPPPFEPKFELESSELWLSALDEAMLAGRSPVDAELAPWLLDEARLEPADYGALRDAAALRLLALREAERKADSGAGDPRKDAFEAFRRARRLFKLSDVQRWCQENDLSPSAFDRLMAEEGKRKGLSLSSWPGLEAEMLNQLRLTGRYAALAQRAREKRDLVQQLGYEDPRPEDVFSGSLLDDSVIDREKRVPALLRWYFGTRVEGPVPEDLSGFVEGLGLGSLDEFYRLITRDYLYWRHAGGGGTGGRNPDASGEPVEDLVGDVARHPRLKN
ncbi:MAG: YcaO-like family protein [Kiloniellales bacterium]|nr:YcaO-like family protein [Kiloniellales bacterium]